MLANRLIEHLPRQRIKLIHRMRTTRPSGLVLADQKPNERKVELLLQRQHAIRGVNLHRIDQWL